MNAIERTGWPRAVVLALGLVLVGRSTGAAEPPIAGPEPDVGWCAFYPSVDVGMDVLPGSGATILSVCAGGWSMAPAPGRYDFSALDRQIGYAERHGLKLALINEINPLYTPEWLRRQASDAGQSVRNASGVNGPIPSITSPLFAKAQEELVSKTVEFVKQRDRTGVVRYYHPGAEWWFPIGERYNPADIARFREWLRRRYGTVEKLDSTWRAHYASFDEVPAPRIDTLSKSRGRAGLATVYSLDDGPAHASWSTAAVTDPNAAAGPGTFAAVSPGKNYTASAWVRSDDLRGPGALVELAWVGPHGGAPLAIDDGDPVRGTALWRRIAVTARAPNGAGRAWILLKQMGSGTATFDDVELREEGSGPNLAPNPGFESGGDAPTGWSFQNWGGGPGVTARYAKTAARGGSACVRIAAPRPSGSQRRVQDDDAAVHDWTLFWYEAAADYINSLAHQVKHLDPTRKTVTYLTMSWAFPSEWDETQRSAIAPDEVAMRGRDIDVFGMQLCAADGDPYRVTACLDLMRKYEKPLWAVDLVDFTSGVDIGYPAMDRITQATVQHGAQGIIYCAWHIPTVLDYSFYPGMRRDDVTRMLTDARTAIRLMKGMSVRPAGALVQPLLPASPGDAAGFKNDYRSFVGWYKLLENLHQTADVLTLREIESGHLELDRYHWVVVPDCAALPGAVRARLSAYAKAGGRVVTGGRFGLYDELGRPVAGPSDSFPCLALPDLGRQCAGDAIRDTHAGNTPPLFLWHTDTPDSARALAATRSALGRFLEEAGAPGDFELIDPAPGLSAVAYEGSARRAVYLVNRGPRDALPLRLRLRASDSWQLDVYADVKKSEFDVRQAGERLELTVPGFRSSCIVLAHDRGRLPAAR
jgi:Beta-galactosidase/Beta-galactosidase trimerisation domain